MPHLGTTQKTRTVRFLRETAHPARTVPAKLKTIQMDSHVYTSRVQGDLFKKSIFCIIWDSEVTMAMVLPDDLMLATVTERRQPDYFLDFHLLKNKKAALIKESN